ncbi:MAG: T9SS type A sorting domain-containing protein [Bacteroidota bacterium]
MKKLYFALSILILAQGLIAQTTWDNFEDQRKGTYGFISGTFIPYFANPAPNGVNDSRVVAAYARNPGDAFDVIILDALMADLADYLSGAKQMSIDVWSPAPGLTVQITLENSVDALPDNFPTGRHSAYTAVTTATEEWETLTFGFVEQPDAGVSNTAVDRIVLLFEPNTNNGTQWYFDNLNGPELADDPCADAVLDATVFMDFECQQNVDFTFSHSGINFRRIANPDQNGNMSDFVGSYIRNAAEEFDVIIARTEGIATLDAASTTLTLDVWDSAAPTEVRISLQQNLDDGSEPVEALGVSVSTSGSNAWETLSYDFSGAAGQSFNQIVILFDPANFTADQYYFDNLQLGDPVNTFDVLSNVEAFNAFPNPATEMTNFQYELTESAEVSISLHHANGQYIGQIFRANQAPGSYQIPYSTVELPKGLYFYTLTVDGESATGKLLVQ